MASFLKNANFYQASFKRQADFRGAIFAEGAEFTEAIFANFSDFYLATISGLVFFKSVNYKGPAFKGDFGELKFEISGALSFHDLSLAHVRFKGTDLRRAEFHHVQWHPYRGRQAILDEVLLRQAEKKGPWFWPWFWIWVSCHISLRFFVLESGIQFPQYLSEEFPPPDPPRGDSYGEVERLYRDLQENYEKARDYKKMGDFHYGEMEMHRRASKWRWFPFYWYNLYWALSGYGERPSRAFGLLIFFLAVLTGLLAWAGLEILDPKHSPAFGDSFFYLLQKVTLQRPTWAEPVGFWGKLVAGFSVLLIPGQAALFLLALRNRLGRRR